MRILYVSSENPAISAILGGMKEETLAGLPAFFFPFRMLLEAGNEIDLLLYTDQTHEVTESAHFKKENLILAHPKYHGILATLEYPILLRRTAGKLMKTRHYDFVYGQTEGSHPVLVEAVRRGIPCGLRQYGTQEMANVLEKTKKGLPRKLKALKDYTFITLSMQAKKNFLLATDDGSRANELYDLLGIKKKKFDFYFWHSAVNIPKEVKEPVVDAKGEYPGVLGELCLSHIGRIADVKRQDRSVRILGQLHRRGYPFHLYLIGDVSSRKMYDETVKAAEEEKVTDFVHFVGGKPQEECRRYARNSLATLLPGEWNRVNIFYEVMGEGSVVLTNNNHSIDEFIEDGKNCLVYDTEEEAAEKLISLLHDREKQKAIRKGARETALEKFLTPEKRFGTEVQLVLDTANGQKSREYPEIW